MKRRTIEELIEEYHNACSPGFIERLTDRSILESLRYVGVKPKDEPTPKDKEQLKLEKWLKQRGALLQELKTEIMRLLEIDDAAIKEEDFNGFWLFLLVNFRVNGNEVEKRLPELIMPKKITIEMVEEAACEVDEHRKKHSQ